MGRSSTYTEEIAEQICERLVEGESLRSICRDDSMPAASTVFSWLETSDDFRSKYTRAREVQAELLAEEQLEIADDGRNDWMERNHGENDPGWVANGENIQRSKIRLETRRWIASKLLPKKYGDRLTSEITGADGKDLIPPTDPQEVARRVAFLLAKGAA